MAEKNDSVTEFTVTFFGLTPGQADDLLDFYADGAYGRADRDGLPTPALGSTRWDTFQEWADED